MLRPKIILSLLIVSFNLLNACAQKDASEAGADTPTEETKAPTEKADVHRYGGWYCPDNLGGFPPVDVASLDAVPVVKDRMPTKEEAQNGTSLMYFDPATYPTAKPLDIDLPRLAYYNGGGPRGREVIIVIQAVVVDADTVAGFRYLNGGNGTSWYNEVTMLSDEEVEAMGPTPFVFLHTDIKASKEKVWSAFTKTGYATELGIRFLEQAYFEAEFNPMARVRLHYDRPGHISDGYSSLHFGNIYIQINNDYDGQKFVEKMLIGDNEDEKSSNINLVFGPYKPEEYEAKLAEWGNWLEDVKRVSEEG